MTLSSCVDRMVDRTGSNVFQYFISLWATIRLPLR